MDTTDQFLNPPPLVGLFFGRPFCPPLDYDEALKALFIQLAYFDIFRVRGKFNFSQAVEKRMRICLTGKHLRLGTCSIVSAVIAGVLENFGVRADVVHGFVFHRHRDEDHALYGFGHVHPHSWAQLLDEPNIIDATFDCVHPSCSMVAPGGAIFFGNRPATYLTDPVLVSRSVDPVTVASAIKAAALSGGAGSYDYDA